MSNSSTIKLYKLEKFDANDNVMWDKLDEWKVDAFTNGRVLTYYNFQYIKIDSELAITLPLNQSNITEPNYNFVEIINSDSSRSFYYWVTNIERRGEDSVKFYLSIDTISTFKDLIIGHFTNETKILRQHKDRFIQKDASNTVFYRKIDMVPEVVGLTKYRKSKTQVLNSKKWYLVYTNDSENADTSISGYLVPETVDDSDRIIMTTSSTISINQEFQASNFSDDYVYLLSARVSYGDNVVYPTTSVANLVVIRNENTLNLYEVEGNYILLIESGLTGFKIEHPGANTTMYRTTKTQYNNLYNKGWEKLLAHVLNNTITNNASGEIYQAGSITGFKRTSTKIVSIIECPYCPLNDTSLNNIEPDIVTEDYVQNNRSWFTKIRVDTEFIKAVSIEDLNEFTAILPAQGSRNGISRNMTYESKLYNSDFYTLKFTYDSFSKEIPLELLEPNSAQNVPSIIINYKQSNTLRSDLGFQFIPYNVNEKFTEDYDEYLICNRQNNCALYNSNYLNYMRNGYQFDVKNKNQQNTMNWIGTGIQIGAGVLGLATSAYTGGVSAAAGISLLTSGISSATSNIYSEIKSEQNIEQKKKEAQAQTNSVSVSDDLNLLKWYNGNELLKLTYELSDVQKAKIYQLLYRYGYACYDTGAPNLNSRILFNYIEADIDLDTKTKPELIKYYNDIKERFKKGVTVLHQNGDLTTYCTKENWETWLL